MENDAEHTAPSVRASEPAGRPRGRRRKADSGDTRSSIIAAAAVEFAHHGYDSTSMRAIARRAGVDPALVHHYFGDKADLFAASISAPIRPDRIVKEILAGPRERMGENIIRFLLTALDEGGTRTRAISLIRTALGQEFAAGMLRQFLAREVLQRLASAIGGESQELRASLAASQIVGLIIARYGIRIEPLASAPAEEIIQRVGAVVQWHLTGGGPSASLDSGVTARE
ncbi:MAG TPA: TetR family transcriptional regulator [Lacisediminihabitans sp.]|jgi:AcrR family transcriptional regulator|nr:TetR family transcriptional regulator [Lacisediminihabitans sp.]HXD60952.1 TetR family transcriptional regulator [Lacisediminihabitans sp.]